MAGAWQPYAAADGTTTRWYRRTTPLTVFAADAPRGYGCVAIKSELARLDWDTPGFKPGSPTIGESADVVIRYFQQSKGLTVDGVVGPSTAEALFAALIAQSEATKKIPSRWAAKIVKLESAEDPGAIGWADPNDKGLCEINVLIRSITVAEAFDPSFAIPYLCADLASAYAGFKDWEAAVASWNTGGYWAGKWLAADKPTSGAWDEKNKLDWFARASGYVSLVAGQVLRA